MKTKPARFSDLGIALEFSDSGVAFGQRAYFCRETGETILDMPDDPDLPPLPDDIDDPNKYVAIPDKRQLGCGRDLVFEFARIHLADVYEDVRDIFRKKDAYRRFKDLLERRDKLRAWNDFERDAEEKALREWCAEKEIPITE